MQVSRFLALALSLALLGCSDSSSSRSVQLGATAAAATSQTQTTTPPAQPPHAAMTWWAGDFHVHTDHSGDGVDSVAQSADIARLMGLDFVVFSDHGTLTQTQDPGFVSTPDLELIAGLEWTNLAHMGLIGVSSVPPKLSQSPASAWHSIVQDAIGNTRAQGGLSILYHPAWNTHPWLFPVQDFDAIEVWNNFWTVSDTGLHPTRRQDVDDAYANSGMAAAGLSPSAEVLAMVQEAGGGNDLALHYWENHLDQGRKVAAVGGSDRHKLAPPGYPTTWVLAPGKSQAEVIDAVRAGRTIVTQGPEGPFVEFEADRDGDGVFESTLGDSVPAGPAVTFRVRIRGANGGKARLIADGQVLIENPLPSDDFTFSYTLPATSGQWLRVDVFQPVDWRLPYANQVIGGLPLGSPTSAGQVNTLLSLWGVSVAIGSNYPLITLEERYRRILNFDMFDSRWSRAAITSPIYVR